MKDRTPQPPAPLDAAIRHGLGAVFQDISSPFNRKELVTTGWLALSLGLLYLLLNTPPADLPTSHALSALAWPAPAVGIALLWRRSRREWPLFLAAVSVALFLVGQIDWLPWHVDLVFAALGMLEVLLGAWVARRWVGDAAVLDSTRSLLRFVLLLPGAVAMLFALLTGAALWWAMDAPWLLEAGRVYAAQALAFLTVLPAFLSPAVPTWSVVRRDYRVGLIWLAALGCLALSLLPQLPPEAARAVLALILAMAGLQQTPVGVAWLNVLIGTGLVAMTVAGLGPYVQRGDVHHVWPLQLDLAGLSLLSLGLAVALAERRRLALQFEQTRRMEALGFLAGGIAHDFNNVLGTVGACHEMLADQLPDAPQPLRLLESEVRRGRDLTQQLLLAVRQGDGQRSSVPIEPLLLSVQRSVRALCPPHIHIDCTDALPPGLNACANGPQLLRAVHNLVRNAVQAARAEVRLGAGIGAAGTPDPSSFQAWIGRAPEGAHVRIEVCDDGPGVAPEHWPRLFEPFYSTRRDAGGTGLGLAIVAGVACSHEGAVGLSCQAGRGSRFVLLLPLAKTSP
jgi:signal transduction histidine kinase